VALPGRELRFAKSIDIVSLYCKLLIGGWRGPVPDRFAHQAGTSPLNTSYFLVILLVAFLPMSIEIGG